jgi:hypothetical protein
METVHRFHETAHMPQVTLRVALEVSRQANMIRSMETLN